MPIFSPVRTRSPVTRSDETGSKLESIPLEWRIDRTPRSTTRPEKNTIPSAGAYTEALAAARSIPRCPLEYELAGAMKGRTTRCGGSTGHCQCTPAGARVTSARANSVVPVGGPMSPNGEHAMATRITAASLGALSLLREQSGAARVRCGMRSRWQP